MKPVLVVAAVPQETALLERALEHPSLTSDSAYPYTSGVIGGLPITVCAGGIGKVNAAAATAVLIERVRPRLVIATGCGGAYHGSGLDIGDLAVAGSEVLGDEGVITSKGWLDMHGMGIPSLVRGGQRYFNEIPLSRHASEIAMRLAGSCGIRLVRGRFVTLSTCSGSQARGDELARRYEAVCENMEGAAVALVCLRHGIDCLEIRGISNLVEERDMKTWDIPRAVEVAQRFVLKYLEEMERRA